jgi:hypothetical protein
VHISAGEVKGDPGRWVGVPPERQQFFGYHLGEADIWVSNISPHYHHHFDGEPGGVEFILHVDWPAPLDVAYTITVEDDEVQEIDNGGFGR